MAAGRAPGLAIPIEQSLTCVQPLYLAAAEQGALPQPRRVIVAHGNAIAMTPTLEESLATIFGGGPPAPVSTAAPAPPRDAAPAPLARQAWGAWMSGQEALRASDFARYGAELKRLEDALRTLAQEQH